MNRRIPLLSFVVPAFSLSSCLSTTYQDTLIRAALDGPLPRPPVHLPNRDTSGLALQGSISISASGTEHEVTLKNPDQSDGEGNWGHGRDVTWSHEAVMGSGEVSLLAGRHLRLFAGAQGDLATNALWAGAGIVLGRRIPLELSLSLGSTSLERELEGVRVTTLTDDCAEYDDLGCVPASSSSTGPDTTTWDRTDISFTRIGITLSRRDRGPWGEIAWTSLDKVARTVEGNWTYDATSLMLGGGWAFATPVGRLVAGARAETLGESFDPSLLLQWTGDLPLD